MWCWCRKKKHDRVVRANAKIGTVADKLATVKTAIKSKNLATNKTT